MENSEVFGGISFMVGAIFTAVGAILYKFPPKKINWFYGYRTPASMRSQERWEFAQQFSAIRMFASGVTMMLLSVVLQSLEISSDVAFNLELATIFISVAYMLISTEFAINKKFETNNVN